MLAFCKFCGKVHEKSFLCTDVEENKLSSCISKIIIMKGVNPSFLKELQGRGIEPTIVKVK